MKKSQFGKDLIAIARFEIVQINLKLKLPHNFKSLRYSK